MTRILITGAAGQLGRDLVSVCTRAGDEAIAAARTDLDVGDPRRVDEYVHAARPEIIINCAAWTAVDACESDPPRAMRDNAEAVAHLRASAERVGAHLVQVSTDYVFDGTLDRPYRPDDEPNPQSVYGQSKALGERYAGPSSTVVRTSWVCGEHGANMVVTVLRLLQQHPTLSFVDDQFGNPTFTSDLAVGLYDVAVARNPGIFHLTNTTPDDAGVSWFEFVREIVSAAGRDPGLVHPIATADLDPPRPAPRPSNGVLANTTLPRLRDFREPLGELVAALTD